MSPNDYGGGYTEALYRALGLLTLLSLFSVPLALWKFVDIVLWIARHVHWGQP